MNRTNPSLRRGLIAANVALLGAVVVLAFTRGADAQNSGQPAGNRARGDYTMVAGKTNSGGPSAVYILDAANQEVVALKWDSSKSTVIGIGYRNLATDAQSQPGR